MKLPFTYKIQDLLIRNNFEELEALRFANRVTQLPKNPRDGQRIMYQAQAGPPIRNWIMEYSDVDKKWFWVGGSPAYVGITTDEQVAANVANGLVDLATVGPSFTIPFVGDYEIEYGFNFYQAASAANKTGQANPVLNGVDTGLFVQANSNGGSAASTMRKTPLTAGTAGHVLKLMYIRDTVTTMNYRARWLTVRPLVLTP